MHDNYGPVVWRDGGERWDLLQLENNGLLDGGEQLRARIRTLHQRPDPGPRRNPGGGDRQRMLLLGAGCCVAVLPERYTISHEGMPTSTGC